MIINFRKTIFRKKQTCFKWEFKIFTLSETCQLFTNKCVYECIKHCVEWLEKNEKYTPDIVEDVKKIRDLLVNLITSKFNDIVILAQTNSVNEAYSFI